jgi:hypothetical protein
VVDLIRDDGDAGFFSGLDQRGEGFRGHHGAARIGGGSNHDTLQRLFPMPGQQSLAGHRPARRCICFDPERLATKRRQNVAVRRIAGQCHRHAIPRIEGSEECQNKARRGSGSNDDPCRIEVDVVPFGIGPRNALPQRRHPERLGISKALCRERSARCVEGWCGRTRRRLADLHMDDAATLRLKASRSRHDIHHHERWHRAASGRLQQVFGFLKHH